MWLPAVTIAQAGEVPCVEVSALHTGGMIQREYAAMEGGRWGEKVDMTMSAIAFREPGSSGLWLFDAGLAAQVEEQREAAPWWFRLALRDVRPGRPAIEQLGPAAQNVSGIVLSHAHWDHLSGVVDFPHVPVYAPERELTWAREQKAGRHGILPALVDSAAARFRAMAAEPRADIDPFGEAGDFFGNGSVLFIPVHGHTPGSLLMLASACDGRRFLFIGDEAWIRRAVQEARKRPWFVRWVADVEAEVIPRELTLVRQLASRLEAVVIPAHDRRAHDAVPEYPSFAGAPRSD